MSKPPLIHQATSATVIRQDDPPTANDQSEKPLEDSKSEHTTATNRHVAEEVVPRGSGPSVHDILAFIGISIMLIWPWIFFGVVWAKKGIQMNNHVAKVITNNPHATTYFITLICSIISMIVSVLFSLSIIRFAQELVSHRHPTEPFTLSVLLAFRRQTWPWGKSLKDAKSLMTKKKWWPAVLLIICVLTFPHLISSTTSLLTPAPFNRTVALTGTELDFSSTASDCLAWFAAHPIANNCGWQFYKGIPYTNCLGENQMVDVLEAGRGNILELVTNNTQSLTFSQLGAEDGLHFLGPIRGLLPIGPNGVPAFNTLAPSPFSKPEVVAGMTSYSYTLNHQGLKSNVSCSYAQTNPFVVGALFPGYGGAIQYNASCASLGGAEVLTNVLSLHSTYGNNTLVYWACQSVVNGVPVASYTVYLTGYNFYKSEIGNIICTVNPVQAAIFPVTYQSAARIFTTAGPTIAAPIAFSTHINNALIGLGDIISEGQNFQSNQVAESVFTFGVKSFGVLPQQSFLYLQLFEQMIQGILEYETTYIRLIYSTVPNPPASCKRSVDGMVKYAVIGWFVTSANIGFLIPMTIINGAALIALLLAVLLAKTGGYIFHPFHPRPVTYGDHIGDHEQVPDEWRHKVTFHPTSVFKEYFNSQVKDNITDGVKGVAVQTAQKQVGDRVLNAVTSS